VQGLEVRFREEIAKSIEKAFGYFQSRVQDRFRALTKAAETEVVEICGELQRQSFMLELLDDEDRDFRQAEAQIERLD